MLILENKDIVLKLEKISQADYTKKYCPAQHFEISANHNKIGSLNFRLGQSKHILNYAGQLGYTIHKEFRGNRYAKMALEAILPYCFQYYKSIFVTCDIDNIASIKTIEYFLHKFHGFVKIPKSNQMYREGHREKRVYEILEP